MKPSIPKGTRDFGPAEMQKRQYILNIIRKNFELFGYQPIETPSFENLETLTGKYGDEGDKLIFKILNSGNFAEAIKDTDLGNEYILKKAEQEKLFEIENLTQEENQRLRDLLIYFSTFNRFANSKVVHKIAEKALRYDLTVPFARYVVMNQHQLTFPFKRYQIQPVWRADRPQKGRYREFYQCDADVIGSDSLINELDLISLIDKCFSELDVKIKLKINNRKILSGIAEKINEPDKIIDITVAIDKIDKIGLDGVNKELSEKGISDNAIQILQPLFTENIGNYEQSLNFLKEFLSESEIGKQGINELEFLFHNAFTLLKLSSKTELDLDITLARGLNYYTGTIFEVKANAGTFTPSILGGGRYDDLTGIFGLKDMSGVGISFGIDRIYDVMEELNVFPKHISKVSSTKLLFAHFDTDTQKHCLQLAAALRAQAISCEIYPDVTKKLGKQFDYANKKNIPFVCTVGGDEIASQTYALKNMATGEQKKLSLSELINELK